MTVRIGRYLSPEDMEKDVNESEGWGLHSWHAVSEETSRYDDYQVLHKWHITVFYAMFVQTPQPEQKPSGMRSR